MIDHIYDMLDEMEEELEGAEDYAEKGRKCQDPNRKEMYFSMAHDELGHFDKLGEMLMGHSHVGEEMKEYIAKKHAEMLEKYAFIKFLISK